MTIHADQHDDRLLQFALADPDHPVWEDIVGQLVACEDCRASAYALADDLPTLVHSLGLSPETASARADELVHRLDEVLDEAMQRLASQDAPAGSIAPPRRSWLAWGWMPLAAAVAASLVIVLWPSPPSTPEGADWAPVAEVLVPEQAAQATDDVIEKLTSKGLGMAGSAKPHDFLVGYARGLARDLRKSERGEDQKRLQDMLVVRGVLEPTCVTPACKAGSTAYTLLRDLDEASAARILRSPDALQIVAWARTQPHLTEPAQSLHDRTAAPTPSPEEIAAWRALVVRALDGGGRASSGDSP